MPPKGGGSPPTTSASLSSFERGARGDRFRHKLFPFQTKMPLFISATVFRNSTVRYNYIFLEARPFDSRE